MSEVRGTPMQTLVELTAAVCLGNFDALVALRQRSTPDRRWREALLQVHLFAGFPAVVEAFARLERVGGVGPPEPDEALLEPDQPERGADLFKRIYGEHAARVGDFLRAAHPQLGSWVLGHAYGRVLTRPGLLAHERELLAVAALGVRGPERQLASHLRGAIACGAAVADVLSVFECLEHCAPGALVPGASRLVAEFARRPG